MEPAKRTGTQPTSAWPQRRGPRAEAVGVWGWKCQHQFNVNKSNTKTPSISSREKSNNWASELRVAVFSVELFRMRPIWKSFTLRRGDVEFLETSAALHLKFQLKMCLMDMVPGDEESWPKLLGRPDCYGQLWDVISKNIPNQTLPKCLGSLTAGGCLDPFRMAFTTFVRPLTWVAGRCYNPKGSRIKLDSRTLLQIILVEPFRKSSSFFKPCV